MGRGTYKYICEECQADNWLTARERNSRFMPKCVECGSSWLEPSAGSKAKKTITEASDASRERSLLTDKKMNKKTSKEQ